MSGEYENGAALARFGRGIERRGDQPNKGEGVFDLVNENENFVEWTSSSALLPVVDPRR